MKIADGEKLVSAIVPAYKTEPYLDVFLESVRSQTILERLEVVLDLNLPSAVELEIVKKHQGLLGDCLKVIVNDKLNSISASMNNAINHSTGQFIAIWNIDDLRTPDSLERQLEILLSDSSIACAIGPYIKVSQFMNTCGITVDERDLNPATLLSGMHLGPFFMFPKSITKKIGFFDEQLRSGGDFDFAIRLARSGKVQSTDALLGWYLDAGLGASTRPNSLQPTEATVIEIRYGIFHKIDPIFIPSTYPYSIPNVFFHGRVFPVENFFEGYTDYMRGCLDSTLSQKNRKNNLSVHKILGRLRQFLRRVLGM